MATQGGIADDLLVNLAGDIETGEQVEALGRTLGFKAAAINRYTETNIKGDRVTCKGTRDMLFDWRQTVEPGYQHLRLEHALIEAKLVMLADTYLKETPNIPDIYSKNISDTLTVQRCREKLENKYINTLCKIPMKPWDPNDYAEFKDMHTVVTMVKKDSHGRDLKKKDVLQGSVAKIFSTKVNGRLPARILISAPAGRGKTTAVAKMAYDWVHRVRGSALEHLPLLFVLKLRNTGKFTSIGEAIKAELLSDVDDLTPQGLEKFIRENQDFCHIILDGLDEYAGISSKKQSFESNIVSVILWKEYRECRVLVTTRPHLENFFNNGELPKLYTKMWIEGFSRKSSREYIDKFFASSSDLSKAQSLKAYLDNQPLINELVITPLFCLMVCHLWSVELLKTHITTQTELLDSVNVFMMHHCNARLKTKKEISEEKLREIIRKLGKIALFGLLDDAKKLIFTPQDFRRVPAILEEACELGVISKTTVSPTCLPRSNTTTYTTIEFYHRIAQEHSAGKYLAAKSKERLWPWQTSLLKRILSKIEANIGDYENLIRFAAGTENNLCIMIMEALLANRFLDESERYRILLDCSSETSSTEGNVSSLIQRCVTAQSMVLKSPTVYTVVGMQNLPEQLISQIREVKFEDSAISADVTTVLWSCLGSFPILQNLTISDSSLSFPLLPPELQSVKKLVAERVTSHSYEGLLSSVTDVEEIDVTINDAERDITQITAGLRRTGGQQLTRIALKAPTSLLPEKKEVSGETIRRLGVLIREQTKNLKMLLVSGVNSGDEEDLVALSECCRHAKALNCLIFLGCGSKRGGKLESYAKDLLISKERLRVSVSNEKDQLPIEKCQLSTEMTIRLWSSLRLFTSLNNLFISDSSLSFPPSPPKLTSVTKLKTERVTSQSYEGLLSSLPRLKEIDITMDDAEGDISQIKAALRRTGGQQESIALEAPATLPSEKKDLSRETMRGLSLLIKEHLKNLKSFSMSGVKCIDEEYVNLIESSQIVHRFHFQFIGWGSLDYNIHFYQGPMVTLGECQLSTEMAVMLWTCLRSFASLSSLTISDSSLSFPPSPSEITSVTMLKAERVTSQSYEGLLSSLPGLEEIDITIDDAERDISQITAALRRTGGQQVTNIRIEAPALLPSEKRILSRETMKGLSHLREHIKSLKSLSVSGGKCTDEDYVDLIESSKELRSLHFQFLGWGSLDYKRNTYQGPAVTLDECQLSTEMTVRLWTCLKSLTSLGVLTISDSSLSFPPSPPELTSVLRLKAERVTSRSYEGLFYSLPSLREIDITIDNVERVISQITPVLRRTRGQQLTHIHLHASDSIPPEKTTVSRETMRGLGLLIKEQTKNLREFTLISVKCTDEENLVYLIECCRRVEAMRTVWLFRCGTKKGGRLQSHLKRLPSSGYPRLAVDVTHDAADGYRSYEYRISHI